MSLNSSESESAGEFVCENNLSKENTHTLVDTDAILNEYVGSCGLWQWSIVILITLTTSSITTFPIFANSASPHRCRMEPMVEDFIARNNLSFPFVASRIGPWQTNRVPSNTSYDAVDFGCYRYALSWTNISLDQYFLRNGENLSMPSSQLESCNFGYIHEDSVYHYPGNVVAEFETVCDLRWLVPLGEALFMFGMLIGFILGGVCGDWIGRKYTIILGALIEIVSGVLTSFSYNYTMYVIARMIMAIGTTVKISTNGLLVLELTLARYRSMFCGILGVGVNFLFRTLTTAAAYWIPDWRWLNVAFFCPQFGVLIYFFVLPESPRWLVSQNRIIDALKVFKSGYRINHVFRSSNHNLAAFKKHISTIEEKLKLSSLSDIRIPLQSKKNKMKQLLKAPFLRLICICTVSTGCMVMGLFGLLLYARTVRSYVYLIGLLNSITAIPATLISILSYRYLRYRKRPLICVNAIASLFLAVGSIYTIMASPSSDLVLTICSNVGLVFVSTSVYMLYVYMPELFPSDIRGQAFGLLLGLARFGSVICSFINELDYIVAHGLPVLVIAVVLFLNCLLLIALPDTTGDNLADKTE